MEPGSLRLSSRLTIPWRASVPSQNLCSVTYERETIPSISGAKSKKYANVLVSSGSELSNPGCFLSLRSSLWGRGKRDASSSFSFLLSEALCPVFVHPFWKDCQLVKPVVLELSHLVLPPSLSPSPMLLGTHLLYTSPPPPKYLQGHHISLLLSLPVLLKEEHSGNGFVFLCPLQKRPNCGPREVPVLQRQASGRKEEIQGQVGRTEAVPEGLVQAGQTLCPK